MAFNSNILNIPLDGTGTEIPTLNVTDPYEKYLITGANTTIGNYAIVPTGTPQLGTTFLFKYKATTDITTNGNTFAIFGQALTQNQLLIELDIECYYTGSAWVVEVKPSLTTAFVEAVNIVASAVTTSAINNLAVTTGKINTNAVTNAKLAQMATLTVKANITGGTADPSDVAISSLVPLSGWGLAGNAGTTAGTNFIGTTDNIDLVFKVNNIESGKLWKNSNNISLGLRSLNNITSGTDNSAFGYNSLIANTSGNYNVGIGATSLVAITSGESNVGVGVGSGNAITTGDGNTLIGASADVDDINAQNRIALGANANATADYQFAIPDNVTTIKFRGFVYNLPTLQAAGVLTNDGSGNLTWS